jgi:hypothetical protein
LAIRLARQMLDSLVAYGARLLRPVDCLSQGDFRSAETHRNPGGDKLQHELAGVTSIVRQVIGKLDAVSPLFRHDPHFKRRSACRKTVPVYRQPVPLGEVEKHGRAATRGNDPPGRGIRLEPMLFKTPLPCHASHPILSIQDKVCSTVGIEHRRRGSQLLEPAAGFLAARAIAGAGHNRPADGLEFHLAAPAYRREVFVLIHRDRPFLDSIDEAILPSVRNVCNRSPASFPPRPSARSPSWRPISPCGRVRGRRSG